MLALTFIMSFEGPQTWAGKKVTSWLNKEFDLNTSLSSLSYSFPNQIIIGDVYIPDEEGDTLIYAKRLNVHFTGFSSSKNMLTAASVSGDYVKCYMLTKPGDSISNMDKFSDKFDSEDDTLDDGRPEFGLEIGEINLKNSSFRLEDLNCHSCTKFWLTHIQIKVKDFDLEGEYLTAGIENLATNDIYNLNIRKLKGQFAYLEQELSLKKMQLLTPKSEISGDVSFLYDDIDSFDDFNALVNMDVRLEDGSNVTSTDIQNFAPKFPDFGEIEISGDFSGKVDALKSKNLDLMLGGGTYLTGDLLINDPTELDRMYIKSDRFIFTTNSEDAGWLVSRFTTDELPSQIQNLGEINFEGSFNGFIDDFKTRGRLFSDVGTVEADLNLNKKDSSSVIYKGDLFLTELDLGVLLQDTSFGLVSADMILDGKGFDPSEMKTSFIGKIPLFQYRNYSYTGIEIDGNITEGDFTGKFEVKDPNILLDFNGKASLSKELSKYDFVAHLDSANLMALNLTKDSIINLSSELDINFTARNYDKWKGSIKVTNTLVENTTDLYFFQDILVNSDGFRANNRFISVRSGLLDLDITGDYTLKGIRNAFGHHFQRMIKFGRKEYPVGEGSFSFKLDIKNTRILSEVFLPELQVKRNSHLEGEYISAADHLDFEMQSPGFVFKDNGFNNLDIDYKGGSNISDIDLYVKEIDLSNGIHIDSLRLANEFIGDTLFFDFNWLLRDSIESKTLLHGYAMQHKDNGFQFGIRGSEFNIGDKTFTINEGNAILLDSAGIHIDNLIINGARERIAVNGNLSRNPYEILRLELENFDMNLVNYFVASQKTRFKGGLHGGVIISEALSKPKFAANLFIDSLEFNEKKLGNLNFSSDWVYGNESVTIKSVLRRGELSTLDLSGVYSANSDHNLDINIQLEGFNLKPFNPFLQGIAYNLRGELSGDLKISGSLDKPVIKGELSLPKVAFTLATLETDYNLTGVPKIKILPDKFVFDELALRDTRYGTKGTLSGKVSHKHFEDFNFDLTLRAEDFLALNTRASTEEFYYGTAFVSGDVNIIGPVETLLIKANVKAGKNSSFYLALDAATDVQKSDFVTFVGPNDGINQKLKNSNNKELGVNNGISLDFNIDVDQGSDVQVIIDQQTGTRLTASGDGAIRLLITPYQDIQMFGTYTLQKGNFLLSLENLIKKEFEAEPGGTVAWNGSPTEAILNISAKYETRADPSPLVPNYDGGRTLVNVLMHLSGQLEDPDITFNLEAPRANSSTQTFIANRLIDDDKMNQQVFSLLTFNAFVPDAGMTGGAIVSNGANGLDFLASQASNWINQLTGDYNVTLNYQNSGVTNNQDPTAVGNSQEEVEVGVSKQFFKNRVTVNGRVGVAVGENQRRDQIAGDFEIEYSITKDGKLRTKAFNRSVQDQYSFTEQNYQQGVGIFYKLDFDRWMDLFKKDKAKSETKKDSPNPPSQATRKEEENSLPPSQNSD